MEGLEPPLTCVKQILSLSRLPFRHTGVVEIYYAWVAYAAQEKDDLGCGRPSKIGEAENAALPWVEKLPRWSLCLALTDRMS